MQTEKLVSLLKSMQYDGAVEPKSYLSDTPDFWVERILLEIYNCLYTAANEFNRAAIAELKAAGFMVTLAEEVAIGSTAGMLHTRKGIICFG